MLTIRKATENDIRLIYELINGLANYEKRPQDVTGSIDMLMFWIFKKKIATAVILEYNEKAIGYALYYPIFASFSANAHVHLEDLFINFEYRHQGFGKEFFNKLIEMIKNEGYTKIEWSCLDWNTSAINFYKRIGAKQENGRVYFEYSLND